MGSVSFGGENYIPITVDKPDGSVVPVTVPQWGTDTGRNQPVAYSSGSKMTVTVKFNVLPLPERVMIDGRIGGAISGIGTFPMQSFSLGPNSSAVQSLTFTADSPLPSTTKFYNPMTVNWSYNGSACTGTTCLGSTAGKVYVTLAPPALPIGLFVMLTPLHLAVSNDGAATPAQAFQKTWAQFAGPANVKTWWRLADDGIVEQPLYYYRNAPDYPIQGFKACALNAAALFSPPYYSGQCGSFAQLFLWALAINGIQVQMPADPYGPYFPNGLAKAWFTAVGTTDNSLFLVRDWTFSDPGTYVGDPTSNYWYSMTTNADDWMVPPPFGNVYGDLASLNAIPGQNTNPPSEKMFRSHYIVKADSTLITPGLGGPYFDPSYGVTYTDSAYFERSALDGYVVRDTVNYPDDPTKWKVLNIHVFGPQGTITFIP